jgi:hypothetical protein
MDCRPLVNNGSDAVSSSDSPVKNCRSASIFGALDSLMIEDSPDEECYACAWNKIRFDGKKMSDFMHREPAFQQLVLSKKKDDVSGFGKRT